MIAFKKKTAIIQTVSAVLFGVMHSFVIDFLIYLNIVIV